MLAAQHTRDDILPLDPWQHINGNLRRIHLAPGILQKLGDCSVPQKFSLIQYGDIFAGSLDVPHNMGGQDHDAFLRHFTEQVAEADSLLRVQSRRGFIHDQYLGIVEQGLGDSQPALHAPGKAFHPASPLFCQIHPLQQQFDPLLPQSFGHPRQHPQIVQALVDRHMGVHGKILGQIPGNPPNLPGAADGNAAHGDFSPLFLMQGGQGFHQSGLACAVSPQKPEHTLFYGQVHVLQRLFSAIILIHMADDNAIILLFHGFLSFFIKCSVPSKGYGRRIL